MQEKPTADGKTKRQLVGLERRAIREVLFGEKVEVQKANPKERKDWQKKFCGQKKLKLGVEDIDDKVKVCDEGWEQGYVVVSF